MARKPGSYERRTVDRYRAPCLLLCAAGIAIRDGRIAPPWPVSTRAERTNEDAIIADLRAVRGYSKRGTE